MAAVANIDSTCGSCGKCVKNNHFGMGCEGYCAKRFHIGCVGLVKKDYDKFMELGNKSVWYCPSCRIEVQHVIETDVGTQKKIDNGNVNNDNSPALSVVLDEINTINYSYVALEKRIYELEVLNDRLAVEKCDVSINTEDLLKPFTNEHKQLTLSAKDSYCQRLKNG